MHCFSAQLVWQRLQLQNIIGRAPSLLEFMNLAQTTVNHCQGPIIFASCAAKLWNRGNDRVFNQNVHPHNVTVKRIGDNMKLWVHRGTYFLHRLVFFFPSFLGLIPFLFLFLSGFLLLLSCSGLRSNSSLPTLDGACWYPLAFEDTF